MDLRPNLKPNLEIKTPEKHNQMKIDNLKGHVPDKVLPEIEQSITVIGLFSPLRMAHFLAQVAHESANFKYTEENLNYSSKALLAVFGKYFDEAKAEEYHRKPEQIANVVYANRMGNGDTDSGEGWKFRGRGYIQLTGKNNYTTFAKFIDDDVVSSPDLVAQKYPLLSAGWFWMANGLNDLADQGDKEDNVKAITRRVNGGYNGLEDRIKHFNEFYGLLKD